MQSEKIPVTFLLMTRFSKFKVLQNDHKVLDILIDISQYLTGIIVNRKWQIMPALISYSHEYIT